MSKWWLNFHFWVNYPFKVGLFLECSQIKNQHVLNIQITENLQTNHLKQLVILVK